MPLRNLSETGSQPRDWPLATRLRAHVAIARIDHWSKNVFILPGMIIPLSLGAVPVNSALIAKILIGILSVCLIASSNYVINEVLDARYDRFHPVKHTRPVPLGQVNIPLAYLQWLLLMAAGLALAVMVSRPFTYTMAALWIMGIVYNVPPLRSKDVPYLDVLSESVNNPLRMLAGWYMVTTALVPSLSLLMAYWMLGCYFMALKRYSEFRDIADAATAAAYRKSFRFYSEHSLLVSVMFYSAASMLFFGAFVIRYRVELVLSFPLVAWVMAVYLQLSFDRNSAVQNPEYLHRQPKLMISVAVCAATMAILIFWNIPVLQQMFSPTLPTGR